jgi:hypothetical protein
MIEVGDVKLYPVTSATPALSQPQKEVEKGN